MLPRTGLNCQILLTPVLSDIDSSVAQDDVVVKVDVQILEDCYHWLFEIRDGRIRRESVRDEGGAGVAGKTTKKREDRPFL